MGFLYQALEVNSPYLSKHPQTRVNKLNYSPYTQSVVDYYPGDHIGSVIKDAVYMASLQKNKGRIVSLKQG